MHAGLEQRLRLCRSLPTMPSVALRIVELGNDPDVGIADVADVIALDPALATKLLKVANSPLYGVRRKTDNLRQALGLLGLNTALTLALSFSLSSSLTSDRQHGLDINRYWRRSLLAAEACRCLGDRLGLVRREELFLAGLLQDIGMLVLDTMLPQEYGPLVADNPDRERLAEAERELFGADHAQVGGWLLEQWNMPDYLRRAVAGSHDPGDLDAGGKPDAMVACVAVSGRIADAWLHPDDPDRADRAAEVARCWLNLGDEDYQSVLESMAATLPELSKLFEVDLVDATQVAGILDQARELLVIRNMRLSQEANEARQRAEVLESRTRTLEEQSRRDGLTGLYNRRYLDAALAKEFDQATLHGWPLTIAFIDLDHFKKVNDTYGHQAGDEVLVAVARLLITHVRQTDVVARYGGEEFLLVLPGMGEGTASKLMKRLVGVIREHPYRISTGQTIETTASVGVATHMRGYPAFPTCEALLQAADRAVYAAKHEGRDRVVIYRRGVRD